MAVQGGGLEMGDSTILCGTKPRLELGSGMPSLSLD